MSASRLTPTHLLSRRLPGLPSLAVAGIGSAAVGASIARGGSAGYGVIGLAGGLALIAIFAAVGFPALLAWIPLSTVAFPFVRSSATQAMFTFDRAWIVAVAVVAFATPRRYMAARETRLLTGITAWFVVSYGLRSVTGGPLLLGNVASWVDAIVLPALLYLVVQRTATGRRRAEQVMLALSLAGLILSVIGLAEKLTGFELATRSGGVARFDPIVNTVRISGPYQVPETYALTLLVCFAATLGYIQLRGRSAWIWGGSVAALELAAIGLTLFRAAWISAIVVVVAAFGLRPRRLARTLTVAALVGGLLFAASSPLQKDQTVQARISNVENIQARFATYVDGISIFERHPLFGVGPRNFVTAHLAFGSSEYEGVTAVAPAHSSYILLLAEQGAVGFLPFLALILSGWSVIRRQRRGSEDREGVIIGASIAGAAFAYVFMSASLSMLPYSPSNEFFAVLLGLAAAQLNGQRRPPSGADGSSR